MGTYFVVQKYGYGMEKTKISVLFSVLIFTNVV